MIAGGGRGAPRGRGGGGSGPWGGPLGCGERTKEKHARDATPGEKTEITELISDFHAHG